MSATTRSRGFGPNPRGCPTLLAGVALGAAIFGVAIFGVGCSGGGGGGGGRDEAPEVTRRLPFTGTLRIPTGGDPRTVVAGDFDADGAPEFAVAEGSTHRVVIFERATDGTFSAAHRVELDSAPEALRAVDIDEDGTLDLVISLPDDDEIEIVRGLGDGTFASLSVIPTGDEPVDVVATDLDGDDRLDLVVANLRSNSITAYLGDGAGGFSSPETLGLVFTPERLVPADFNEDGRIDFAVGSPLVDEVRLLVSTGPGLAYTFLPEISTDPAPSGIAAGDWDGDSHADLLVTSLALDRVLWFRGLGDGSFAEPIPTSVGAAPAEVLACDLDRDGWLDALSLEEVDRTVTWLRGDGVGGFEAAEPVLLGATPGRSALADVDGDGFDDLTTPLAARASLAFVRGAADGLRGTPGEALAPRATAFALVDLDADGRTDRVVVDPRADRVLVEYGDEDGAYEDAIGVPIGREPFDLAALDVDRNGTLDLVATLRSDHAVGVVYGDGDRGFSEARTFETAAEPTVLVPLSIDNDASVDLLVSCRDGAAVSVLFGNRFGEFVPAAPGRDVDLPAPPSELVAGDWNADGDMDFAALLPERGGLVLGFGSGNGAFDVFLSGQRVLGREGLWAGRLDDRNGDDLALLAPEGIRLLSGVAGPPPADREPGRIAETGPVGNREDVLRPRRLTPVDVLPAEGDVGGILGGDFDADGHPDLAVVYAGLEAVRLWRGTDSGFEAGDLLAVASRPGRAVLADVDTDGHPDLVVLSPLDGVLSYLFSQGSASR